MKKYNIHYRFFVIIVLLIITAIILENNLGKFNIGKVNRNKFQRIYHSKELKLEKILINVSEKINDFETQYIMCGGVCYSCVFISFPKLYEVIKWS